MNERIKELAKQAGIEFTYDPTEVPIRAFIEAWEGDLEKFAELIVEECMDQVWYSREDGINGNVSEVIKDRIKEHFGVGMSTEDKKTLIKELLGVKKDD